MSKKNVAVWLAVLLLIAGVGGCKLMPVLSPPDWAQGVWSDGIQQWEFRSSTVIWTVGATTIDFGKVTPPGQVSDSSSSTTYTLTLSSGATILTYHFALVSPTAIDCTYSGLTTTTLIKM